MKLLKIYPHKYSPVYLPVQNIDYVQFFENSETRGINLCVGTKSFTCYETFQDAERESAIRRFEDILEFLENA